MSRLQSRYVAAAYAVVSVALLAFAPVLLALTAASGSHSYPPEWPFTLLLGTVASGVGWLLLSRRPDQRVGWAMAGLGLTGLLQTAAIGYGSFDLHVHPLPTASYAYNAAQFIPASSLIPLLAATFLLFPDGKLPSHRWRWAGFLILATFVLELPGQLTAPAGGSDLPRLGNPFYVDAPALRTLNSVDSVLSIIALLLAAASVRVRWRRADPATRQQIKFLLAAAALWPPVVAFLLLMPSRISNGVVGQFVFVAPIMLMVVAVAMAILRYRLYDIDRVVSRTLAYALVTGLLLGGYVGVVAFATKLLPFSSSVGVAASTLTVAAVFNPVRRRVQEAVDRRFNRSRYDGGRLATRCGVRFRAEATVDEVSTTLLDAVAEAVQPVRLSLWLPR